MLGTVANSHGAHGRWWFYVGSISASVLWFVALGLGARLLTPLVRNARTWQVIDTVVGVMMFVFAALLVTSS